MKCYQIPQTTSEYIGRYIDVCVNQNNHNECSNHSKVCLSRIHSMDRQINHNTDQRDEQSEEVPVTPLKSLVAVGSVVAVFTDDSDFYYYLLLVKKTMFALNKDSTDSWGTNLVRGTEVIVDFIMTAIRQIL